MIKPRYVYLVFALLFLALVGSGLGYLLSRRAVDDSARYGGIFFNSVSDKTNDFAGSMQRIALESKSNYAILAKMHLASTKIGQRDYDGAISLYSEMTNLTGVQKFYAEYASYMLAMLYAEIGDKERLDAIPTSTSFGSGIQEIKAFFALKSGDKHQATAIFKTLIEDHVSPAPLKKRASEMISYLEHKDHDDLDKTVLSNDVGA